MSLLEQLRSRLRAGQVYRREELALLSASVDRDLRRLLTSRALEKAAPGLYYIPKKTAFGAAPPPEEKLVEAFLKTKDYLVVSPNLYNSLGVGTTQLYNTTVVYNRRRHGRFELAGRTFDFRMKPRFPKVLSEEFLLVDLMNNLNTLPEDRERVRDSMKRKAQELNRETLLKMARTYGKVGTRKLFERVLKP